MSSTMCDYGRELHVVNNSGSMDGRNLACNESAFSHADAHLIKYKNTTKRLEYKILQTFGCQLLWVMLLPYRKRVNNMMLCFLFGTEISQYWKNLKYLSNKEQVIVKLNSPLSIIIQKLSVMRFLLEMHHKRVVFERYILGFLFVT